MPRQAAAILEQSQREAPTTSGGSGTSGAVCCSHEVGGGGDIEVLVPMVLVVLEPSELVNQLLSDRLQVCVVQYPASEKFSQFLRIFFIFYTTNTMIHDLYPAFYTLLCHIDSAASSHSPSS